ncbi:MAG: hypothetical protein JOZ19_14930 [Rubrobacter sp.]|nr:hypothetical protein [Rubrobacter sp.]
MDVSSTAIKDIKGLLRVRIERLHRLFGGQQTRDVARRGYSPDEDVTKASGVFVETPTDERRNIRGGATTTVRLNRPPLLHSDDS